MTRHPLLLLPFALWPQIGLAQDGPSFNCAYASTRTEIAICANPDLARLEMRMYEAYEALTGRIGREAARDIADDLLERRQACNGDQECIAERLLVSWEVFEQRGRPAMEFTRLDELLDQLPASGTPAEAEPEVPLAAVAPDLPASVPLPPSRAYAGPSLLPEEAELVSSDMATAEGPAAFDTPLSWAFMDLSRAERAMIQERLEHAGVYRGPADAVWTDATRLALEDMELRLGPDSFDLATQAGAALLLDYIGSDAFAATYGIPEASVTDQASAGEDVATSWSIEGTDW